MQVLLAILFILGAACLSWVMFQAIQPGQMLGAWQRVLDKAYTRSKMLEMFLGGCYKCFAHLWGVVGFVAYLLAQYKYDWLGWWNALIYFGFVPAVIVCSMIIDRLITPTDAV